MICGVVATVVEDIVSEFRGFLSTLMLVVGLVMVTSAALAFWFGVLPILALIVGLMGTNFFISGVARLHLIRRFPELLN